MQFAVHEAVSLIVSDLIQDILVIKYYNEFYDRYQTEKENSLK